MTGISPERLGAAAAVELLRRRALSVEELVRCCLDRIERREPEVLAWAWLEPEKALAEARARDAGPSCPPLYGLPVGIKDIIDTVDAPTECGTPLLRGRRPTRDAACVAALRSAGAVVLGKTVTTELAFLAPGPTRNPRGLGHTPGGSSSGSAAAVADFMVPAALGTQTAGSIVRPAAFCGVVGFKPSYGLLSLHGVHPFAPSLDTLGVLVREVADVSVMLEALGLPVAVPVLARPPRVGLWRTARWSEAKPAAQERLERVAGILGRAGAEVREVTLGPEEGALFDAQASLMAAEASASLRELRASSGPGLSQVLQEFLARGDSVGPDQLRECKARARRGGTAAAGLLTELDVLLTASATGEAPEGWTTGDPVFNRLPTLLGLPSLNLPTGVGPAGLPLGVQLVGALRGEGPLIAVASWIAARLEESG
jgi:Asp-tRNA(Asn)/Glu-tRNA(Gln) amidotransferase A subunit family amidase